MQHFQISEVRATQAALERISSIPVLRLLAERHANHDWSNLPRELQETNRRALADGGRVLSLQALGDGDLVWVITNEKAQSAQVCMATEIASID